MNDRFYFNTDRESVKAVNLGANPNCIISPENAVEAVTVEGSAQEVRDASALRRFISLFDAKYHWKLEVTDGIFYQVRPRIVLGFLESAEDFAASATRWVFNDKPALTAGSGQRKMRSHSARSKQ